MARNVQRVKFGQRLRQARTDANLSQQEVATAMGVSKQLVSHWEIGRSEITVFDAVRVADIVRVDLAWLLTGSGQRTSTAKLRSQGSTTVPKLDLEEVLSVARGRIEMADISTFRLTDAKVSRRAFCFDVFDRSMEPLFQIGHTVVVDPEHVPEPGDCVLVALNEPQQVIFGRYKPAPESRPGQPPFTIEFDNRFYEPRLVTLQHQPVFMGTMIEHIAYGSR